MIRQITIFFVLAISLLGIGLTTTARAQVVDDAAAIFKGKTYQNPIITGRSRKTTTTAITAGATPAVDASVGDVFTLTPGEDETISISNQASGQDIILIVLTSGATSRTLTFGTGFKPTGTLATGTASGKYFIMRFFSDGTNCYEVSRTAAE